MGQGVTLFQDNMGQAIIDRLQNHYPKQVLNTLERIVVFCEFFGPNSFAGMHEQRDTKELKVFDVHLFKKGFIAPKDFVEIFSGFGQAAELLYQGTLTQPYIDSVRADTSLGEGVVCKALVNSRVEMCTIKTDAWLTKLKIQFTNWEELV